MPRDREHAAATVDALSADARKAVARLLAGGTIQRTRIFPIRPKYRLHTSALDSIGKDVPESLVVALVEAGVVAPDKLPPDPAAGDMVVFRLTKYGRLVGGVLTLEK